MFKVGDIVRVKDLSKCEDKHPYITSEMIKYMTGKVLKIEFINTRGYIEFELPFRSFKLHPSWLELVHKCEYKPYRMRLP